MKTAKRKRDENDIGFKIGSGRLHHLKNIKKLFDLAILMDS